MKSILVDAGPLIALFDSSDAHHANVRDLIRDIPVQLITTWPVVTEVSHMLDFDVRAQLDFFRWLSAEGVTLYEIDGAAIERIIELTSKYQDRPMELADASLVIAAERLKLYEVISIDRDFDIYRTADRQHIKNVYLERE